MNGIPPQSNSKRTINVSEVKPGYSRGSTKAVDSKRMIPKDNKGRQGATLLSITNQNREEAINLKYKISNPKNQLATLNPKDRSNSVYNSNEVHNSRTEQGILKMVDKRINQGLKAVNKSNVYN
jgi:hypothetical protein